MMPLELFLLGMVLILSGNREVRSHVRGLRRITTSGSMHPWEPWGRRSGVVWGLSLIVIALGFLYHPIGQLGWIAAGISRLAVIPAPCDTPFFNKGRIARMIRNLFMALLGIACIAFGLGMNPIIL